MPRLSNAAAHLHSIGKGANRSPLDCPLGPSLTVLGLRSEKRSVRSPPPGGVAVSGPWQIAASAAGELRDREVANVTTMSSAEPNRRDFLFIATSAVAAVGAVGALWPLVAQMNPDASTIAAGAPIEVDLTPIAEGQVIKVFWRSKPIFINHRTKKQIEDARNVDVAKLPDPQPDSARVKPGHEQWQVLIAICTHLGCIPLADQGPYNGYFCPCHGSIYDTSGRIRQGPAPLNLALPTYEFLSDTKIRIG
jgi:ubiquinol-cytochrome c reductase iron-sulfur subunit